MNEYAKTSPAGVGTLAESNAFINNNAKAILIMAQNPFFMTLFKSNPEYKKELERVVFGILGKSYAIIAQCSVKATDKQKDAVKLIEKASESGIATETVS